MSAKANKTDERRKRRRDEFGDESVKEDGFVKRSHHDAPLAISLTVGGDSNDDSASFRRCSFISAAELPAEKGDQRREEIVPTKNNDEATDTSKRLSNKYYSKKQQTEDIDEREMDIAKFDPVCFFSSPTFPPEQVKQAKSQLLKAIDTPLKKLEDGGIQAFLAYQKNKNSQPSNTEICQRERLQKLLKDATITGDPRKYQRVLFEIAKKDNTIINMGTGFGKTLIALMLIKHFSPAFEDGKQTLFLVPSVALAVQQSITIRANLPNYSVKTACYTSKNSDGSREALSKSNVIVATHGAILDLLMHYADIVQMNRFNLIVIDECHYATGNHTYSLIMNKFYHTIPKEQRPHILGLTASPLVNVKETHSDDQLEAMLSNLEQTLDSRLVSAFGMVSESRSALMMKSAKEYVVDYHGTNVGRAIPSAENLELHEGRFREFKQLDYLYKELGPLVVGLYSGSLIRELSRNEFENESAQQFKTALKLLLDIKNFCAQECTSNPNLSRTDKLLALEELLAEEIEDYSATETVGLVFVERRITAMALQNYFQYRNSEVGKGDWVHAKKLRKRAAPGIIPGVLVPSSDEGDDDQFGDSGDDPFAMFPPATSQPEHLQGESKKEGPATLKEPSQTNVDQFMDADDDDLELGFVNSVSCEATSATAASSTGTPNRIKSSAIVRNATQIFKSLCPSRKSCTEQEVLRGPENWLHQEMNVREILTKMRRREINLLFATSVVEEGVDVQACSFVAVFDALKNTKGYIQMKGRARHRNSKFFVFRNVDDRDGSNLPLKVAQEMERRVQTFIETKTRTRLLEQFSAVPGTSGTEIVQNEAVALESGCYTVAHGSVSMHSAKSLLNRYALSVPIDPHCRNSKESLFAHLPFFGAENLVLPSHLPAEIRVVSLPNKYDDVPRKERHKLLSLVACVRLHSLGLLNDRLLPLTRKDMQKHIFSLATQAIRTIPYYPASTKQFYGISTFQGYIYPIRQSSEAYDKVEQSLGGNGHRLAIICSEAIGFSIPPITLGHMEFGSLSISFGDASTVSCTNEQVSVLSRIFVLLMNDRWRRRSRSMRFRLKEEEEFSGNIPPYSVGIIGEDGHLDWGFMDTLLADSSRSTSERIQAVRNTSSESSLPSARLWAPVYDENVPYIVYGASGETCAAPFPHEKEGVNCYQDYFQKCRNQDVSVESALFDAKRMWTKSSTLAVLSNPHQFPRCKELASVKLPQEACLESPLANAHISLLCSVLPQALYVYERYMNTKAFVTFCKSNFSFLGQYLEKIEIEKIATALTAKSCSLDTNYDKLEWFGDAVLKLVQTDSLIKSIELRHWIRFLHEGDLSTLRSTMGSNDRLKQICQHLQLDKFVMSTPLARGQWKPAVLEYCEGTQLTTVSSPGSKVYADVVESILGLLHLELGYEAALKTADDLQVTLPRNDDFTDSTSKSKPNKVLLDAIRNCTGYDSFRYPELAEEAFTHPSANHPGVSSYQRLEWIGDAVLCLYTRDLIFKDFKELSLGEMVVFEAALVTNETLAFLSVRNRLQHYLRHNDTSLPSRIEAYCWNVREQGSGLWGADPPKSISDIVESVIGAVYMDGGYSAGQDAVRKLMSPLVSILLEAKEGQREEVDLKHPKKVLHELGGEILELGNYLESDFVDSVGNVDVCNGGRWGGADPEGNFAVGTVEICGSVIMAVKDPSPIVARNKACALVVNELQNNEELKLRLLSCRTNIERALFTGGHQKVIEKSDTEEEES